MVALHYSLATYGHVADWFLKCDDDTLDFSESGMSCCLVVTVT